MKYDKRLEYILLRLRDTVISISVSYRGFFDYGVIGSNNGVARFKNSQLIFAFFNEPISFPIMIKHVSHCNGE